MKKIWFSGTILALLGLFLATTQVLAGPPTFANLKKAPTHTPGPQATGQANQYALQGSVHSQGKRVNYRGSITAVNASNLTISLKDGSSLKFNINADTRIKIPTLGRSASTANLKPGMQVNINANQEGGGTLTARIVLAVPGKPTLAHRVGTVTNYQPGKSITIQAKDGNSYTFLLKAGTKILPAERAGQLTTGVRVTVIAPRDVAGGTLTALGIVVHPS